MKKRTLLAVLLLAIVVLFTGCENKKYETIEIKDENHGLNTVFRFEEGQSFKVTDVNTDNKFVEVTFKNEDLNLETEVYYFEITNNGWNSNKTVRQETSGFKEYTWNKYNGYIYSAGDKKLYFNIMLFDGGNEKNSIGLFGSVDAIDYNKGKALENFNSAEFQAFLNSIEFTKS